MMDDKNPYLPYIVNIEDAWYETPIGDRAVKTFKVTFADDSVWDTWSHRPGNCAMVGCLGVGESMFCISSSPTEEGYLRFSIMQAGSVTSAIHQKDKGDQLTVRGPLGNSFPVEEWEGKNIISIGGGIGQAPLRPVIKYVLANREKYGDVKILYGARTSSLHCFKDEFGEYEQQGSCCHLAIDIKEEGWEHYVGFVPDLLMEVNPSPENAIAVVCGPPILIKFVTMNLEKLGFAPEQVYTTLEERMKCGIGKCGRCNVGSRYVCKDGPVFSYAELKTNPESFA